MSTITEAKALFSIAARQDVSEIKATQTAARKSLRHEAKRARQHLDKQRKQINIDLKAAIVRSDACVVLGFEHKRQGQLAAGVLAQSIARQDALGGR